MAYKLQPRCIIIAGPNGAGKTTFAKSYLLQEAGVENFINADYIAAGLSPLLPERAARAAGRVLLEELERLTVAGESFALESTLSGMTYVGAIQRWKKMGYRVEIVFLKLDTPKLALNRIAMRVAQGGHNIPKPDVLRRFERGWKNFQEHYSVLADNWWVYDASGDQPVLWVPTEMSSPKRPAIDLQTAAITRALKRAAKEARRIAKMHGTKVWVMKDGKVVGLGP